MKPLGAGRLPQQGAQSGCKGLRQARAEQAGARGRSTEFEAERPKTQLKSPEKMLSSPTVRPTEDSNLAPPSYAGGVPPGKSQMHVSDQVSAISACRHGAY